MIFVYGVAMMAASEARLFSGFAVLNCCDAGIVRSPILAQGTAFGSNLGLNGLEFWGNQAIFGFQRQFGLYEWPSVTEILFFLRHSGALTGRRQVRRTVHASFQSGSGSDRSCSAARMTLWPVYESKVHLWSGKIMILIQTELFISSPALQPS